MWMNRWEIDEAVSRYAADTVRGRAARFLKLFSEEVDDHSDGWSSWPVPGRAAEKLMKLLERGAAEPAEAEFRKALAPIKSFYTRRGYSAGMKYPFGFK